MNRRTRHLSTDPVHGQFLMGRLDGWGADRWHAGMRVLATMRGETCLGGVVFEHYTGEGGSVIGHLVGIDKHWITKDFLYCSFDFVFNVMKVRKAIGHVKSRMHDVLAMDMRLGFQIETVIKDVYPDDHCVIVSMTREQCRWLDPKYRPAWMEGTLDGQRRTEPA
jgi:hypothetical protein